MRSRYAAFALGLGEYLVETLASDHPDLELPREALIRDLSRAREKKRFMGLAILHAPDAKGDEGEVMFHARIFERGIDCSFVELSHFTRESLTKVESGATVQIGGNATPSAWRYASGIALDLASLPENALALAPAELRAIVLESGRRARAVAE